VVMARYNAAEAQVRINEAVTGVSQEFADLTAALARAEEKTEDMQARASAIDRLVQEGILDSGLTSDGADAIAAQLPAAGAGLGGRGGLGLLAMGVVALTVLVTSGIAIAIPSYQAGRPISGEGAATGVPGPASAGAGDGCPLLQPGAALALAANDGCGVARVASSLDCGRVSKLPDGWTFDGTGTGSREPLSFIGQTCHLFVPAYLE